MTPKISIILPVCHGGRFLNAALVSLRALAFQRDHFEVIVAGEGDDHESRVMVESESAVVDYDLGYIAAGSPKRSVKLNAACSQAKGRILAFADDDCIFNPDWLDRITIVLDEAEGTGAVGGRDVLEMSESPFDLALDLVLNSFLGAGGMRRGTAPALGKYYPRLWNMAVPRRVAESVSMEGSGGRSLLFNEELAVHEDVELMDRIDRAGWRLVFAPDLVIRHRRDTSFNSFVKRNFNMARACRSLKIHRTPHIFLSVLFSCGVLFGAGSIFIPQLRVLFTFLLGLCGMPLASAGVIGLFRTGNVFVMFLAPALLCSLYAARAVGYFFPAQFNHPERTGK